MLIISQLILCSLCFNSVLTKKIHSSASRAVQPSRSQYDQRYHRKKLWRPQPRSWRTPRSNPGFEHFSTWLKFVLDLDLRSQLVVLLHDVVHVVLCNIGSLVWLLCSDSFVQHFFEAGFVEKIFWIAKISIIFQTLHQSCGGCWRGEDTTGRSPSNSSLVACQPKHPQDVPARGCRQQHCSSVDMDHWESTSWYLS